MARLLLSISKKVMLTNGRTTGIGENIRGSVMSAVEALGGSEEAKAKDDDIVAKGRSEIEQGIAQMKGATAPGSTIPGPEHQVESKTDDLPQSQPEKKEAGGPTPVLPSSGPTNVGQVRTDDPQSQQAEQETGQKEATGQKEVTGQIDPANVQQSS